MSGTLPTTMSATGLQPLTPSQLNAMLIAAAQALQPGLTANLPGSLIEDISSTDAGACIVMDQARVDLVNSASPLGANPFLLYQLGTIYGATPGQPTNASVYVVFTQSPGYVIPIGFTVSDGTNQYAIQDGGIVASSGQTQPLLAIATNSGTFSIPPNTVTQLVTSVPNAVVLTVTNPFAGTPAQPAQTIASYRAQVLQAGQVASTGTAPFLKTLLSNIPGVTPSLISVRSVSAGWEVIVGGSGDPYLIAGAIFQAIPDLSLVVGSTLAVSGITWSGGVATVTTTLNHGYTTGQTVVIAGVTPTGYNGSFTATVISEAVFTVPIASNPGAYSTGGVVTPNLRNVSVSIYNYPDTYPITFVIPPSQTVAIALTWNTNSPNYVSATAVAQLGAAALANYVNGLPIGAPMNLFVLQETFQQSIASILPASLLTRMIFSVSINSVATAPVSGTGVIAGDPESYMTTTTANIVIAQG